MTLSFPIKDNIPVLLPFKARWEAIEIANQIETIVQSSLKTDKKIREIWETIRKAAAQPHFKCCKTTLKRTLIELRTIYKSKEREALFSKYHPDLINLFRSFSQQDSKVDTLITACRNFWPRIITHLFGRYHFNPNRCLTTYQIKFNDLFNEPVWHINLLSDAILRGNIALVQQLQDKGAKINFGIVHKQGVVPPPLFANMLSLLEPEIRDIMNRELFNMGANLFATYFDSSSPQVKRKWWLARPTVIDVVNIRELNKSVKNFGSGEQVLTSGRRITVVDEIFYNFALNVPLDLSIDQDFFKRISQVVTILVFHGIDLEHARGPVKLLEKDQANANSPALALSKTIKNAQKVRTMLLSQFFINKTFPYVTLETCMKYLEDLGSYFSENAIEPIPKKGIGKSSKDTPIKLILDYYDPNSLTTEMTLKLGEECLKWVEAEQPSAPAETEGQNKVKALLID